MAKNTVIEDWSNGTHWTYVITPAYRFLLKRGARQAWKPRTSKSRYQKRWDKYARRRYDPTTWSIHPDVGIETLHFSQVPIYVDGPPYVKV